MELFDEPEKATLSEAGAADNKVDHMKQVVEDAARRMNEGESSSDEPPSHNTSVEGEDQPSSTQPTSQVEGEPSTLPTESTSPTESATPSEGASTPESSTPQETSEAQSIPESSSIEGEHADMSYDYESQSEP